MAKKILIVDDEKPARSKVSRFVRKCDPSSEIVEASSGMDAVSLLASQHFDAVFLDIQMPGMNGFEVVDAVGLEQLPKLVFATAFDEYAIKAFDANAIDYLLKPFTFDRFKKAYDKIVDGDGEDVNQQSLLKMFEDLRATSGKKQRLTIRDGGKIRMIEQTSIMYIKSDEHYAFVHVGKDKFCERKSLKQFENILDPELFKRIHRSTIVNLDFIEEFEPLTHGDYSVLLKDGSRHTVSRRYTAGLGIS
ncbi:MAG: LytR/AlgR family response regulator transcription factor [Puniceicoccaceae bacterium]